MNQAQMKQILKCFLRTRSAKINETRNLLNVSRVSKVTPFSLFFQENHYWNTGLHSMPMILTALNVTEIFIKNWTISVYSFYIDKEPIFLFCIDHWYTKSVYMNFLLRTSLIQKICSLCIHFIITLW
jgi:hypothetical protein